MKLYMKIMVIAPGHDVMPLQSLSASPVQEFYIWTFICTYLKQTNIYTYLNHLQRISVTQRRWCNSIKDMNRQSDGFVQFHRLSVHFAHSLDSPGRDKWLPTLDCPNCHRSNMQEYMYKPHLLTVRYLSRLTIKQQLRNSSPLISCAFRFQSPILEPSS